MKKRIIAIMFACTLLSSAGCGKQAETDAVNTETEHVPEEAADGGVATPSVEIAYRAGDYVKLGDYMGMEVTLNEADYQVTEDSVNTYVDQTIAYTDPYLKDDSKTVIAEGDVIDADYVGKKDGEAFEGGSAQNQIIDVSQNINVATQTGYIEGFTDGLIGAKVGDTVDCEVTFPENYGSEELKGQKVVFTFTINSIGKAMKREDLDDAYVLKNFQAQNVEEFYNNMRNTLEQQAQEGKKTDIRSAVMENLLQICSVTSFPEGLVEARLDEYVNSFRDYYCSDGTELEEFLQSRYGVTQEQFLSESRQYLETTLKQEMILETIAEEENIAFDQDGFDEYITNLVTSSGYSAREDLYNSLGSTQESGEEYFKKVYLENKACDLVAEKAVVNYTQTEDETESVENTEQ